MLNSDLRKVVQRDDIVTNIALKKNHNKWETDILNSIEVSRDGSFLSYTTTSGTKVYDLVNNTTTTLSGAEYVANAVRGNDNKIYIVKTSGAATSNVLRAIERDASTGLISSADVGIGIDVNPPGFAGMSPVKLGYSLPAEINTKRELENKNYEITDHLGNVRTVITDRLAATDNSGTLAYAADVESHTDYYPFGMMMPQREFSQGYRFGFNGQEKDDEVKGKGNSLDFGARIYDGRLGRWLSVDPLQINYPSHSPYNFVRNSPVLKIDVGGEWDVEVHAYNNREKFGYAIAILKDRNGNEVARYICKVVGTHRDRTVTNGDTPTGSYSIGDWKGVWTDMDNNCAYGYNDVLRLTYSGGEAPTTRQGILFHGGRQTDDCDDASWIEEDEPLQYTYGCFRFFDADIANMKAETERLESNDALETPGNVTLSNDLVKNGKGNFSLQKDLDEASGCVQVQGTLTSSLMNTSSKESMSKALGNYKESSLSEANEQNSQIATTDVKSNYSNIKPRTE